MLVLFGFYGGVGFLDGGETSRQFSRVSVFGLIPLMTALEIAIVWRKGETA
jgi:hypothetical protein